MNKKSHLFMLFMAALLWGTTFVAQSIGADYVGAFTYLAGRSWIAVVFLTPVIPVMDKLNAKSGKPSRKPVTKEEKRFLIIASCLSGFMLCAASATQQIGMAYTTASKAGFITALYVIIVPILSIFLKKRPDAKIWACVAVSLIGMYLLCMQTNSFSLEIGDIWMLICAFLFAVEILILNFYAPRLDGVRLSRGQFFVVAILSTVLMFMVESPTMETVIKAMPAICYAGIFSSGIAYTLQIFGQEDVNPTLACLIMSLESVFSALTGWLVLHEVMNTRELTGCVLMFAAIVFAQIELKPRRKT